jgi:hypothetical protein
MAVTVRDTTNAPFRDAPEIRLPDAMRLLRGADVLHGAVSPVPAIYQAPNGDLWEILRFKGAYVGYRLNTSRRNEP